MGSNKIVAFLRSSSCFKRSSRRFFVSSSETLWYSGHASCVKCFSNLPFKWPIESQPSTGHFLSSTTGVLRVGVLLDALLFFFGTFAFSLELILELFAFPFVRFTGLFEFFTSASDSDGSDAFDGLNIAVAMGITNLVNVLIVEREKPKFKFTCQVFWFTSIWWTGNRFHVDVRLWIAMLLWLIRFGCWCWCWVAWLLLAWLSADWRFLLYGRRRLCTWLRLGISAKEQKTNINFRTNIGIFEQNRRKTSTDLEVDESVDEADDDSEDLLVVGGGGGGFSGGLFFGGRPLGAGAFFGVEFFFVGDWSSSLSDEFSGEKMLFFFELAGDFALALLLALFLLAAALFICWCCLTTDGGALPPVDGGIGADLDLSACEATVFFLISFCIRFASACSAFVGGVSSSLE